MGNATAAGTARSDGINYIVKDGAFVEFPFSVGAWLPGIDCRRGLVA